MIKRLAFVFAVSLVVAATVQAEDAGPLSGTVYSINVDGSKDLIPGAKVILLPEVCERCGRVHRPSPFAVQRWEAIADAAGRYSFSDLQPGRYMIEASSDGMNAAARPVEALAGAPVTLDVEMKLATVKQSVDVTASSEETIQTSATSVAGTLEERALEHAPSAEERLTSALPLLPGVVRSADGTIFIKGARDAQNGFLVNNASVTDPVTGGTTVNLPLDVVSTVQVVSNPYDPAFGQFSGAITTVETRESNFEKFHFEAQNLMPRPRKRDGNLMGIANFSPRLTVTGPLLGKRLAITQSVEYRFIRTQIPSLPALKGDTGLESFDSFTSLDAHITESQTAAIHLAVFPQKLKFVGLNTFTPQASTPDFHQRGYLVNLQHRYVTKVGGLLDSRASFKEFDGDVRANSTGLFRLGIETTQGGYFNPQSRDTFHQEIQETYNLAPISGRGQHLIKAGFRFARNSYNGRESFAPVEVLRASGALAERIEFGPASLVHASQNETTFFVQDKWTALPRLTLDLGLRFDHDSLTGEDHPAPRIGFAFTPGKDGKSVLRGGVGLFTDHSNLNIPTFTQLPKRAVASFSPSGALLSEQHFVNRLSELRNPISLNWNVQFEREVTSGILLRTGYQQRQTTRNFLLNPISAAGGNSLDLGNGGRSRYREFEISGRYRMRKSQQLTASYVRSSAVGDLNDFNQFFGNTAQPVIRPNERSLLSFDSPHRFVFWGEFNLPARFSIVPVVDVRSGFPYSAVTEERDFAGVRNRAGRLPSFNTLDLQVNRLITIPYTKRKARLGLEVFNLFNHFNPRDVQGNLASARFGQFFNSAERRFGGRLVFQQ